MATPNLFDGVLEIAYLTSDVDATGDTLVKLIEPLPLLYQDLVPKDGFAIRRHHNGHLIRSTKAWERILKEIAKDCAPAVSSSALLGQGIPALLTFRGRSGVNVLDGDARASPGGFGVLL